VSGAQGAARRCVLLVDDDEDSRIIYSIVLEHAGFSVTTARSGDEVLRLALAEMPCVILLDIGLPVLDGFEVMRQLQATPACAIPVIAVTGRVMTHQVHEMATRGFADVLFKPATPKTVLSAVTAALGDGE